MLQSKSQPFNTKAYSGISVQSPLVVLDPYDEDYRTVLDQVKYGAWDSQTAYFNDPHDQYTLITSIHIAHCAQLLLNHLSNRQNHLTLVKIFHKQYGRNTTIQQVLGKHQDQPLVSECIHIAVDYLNSVLNHVQLPKVIPNYDTYMSMVFHDAVQNLALEYSDSEEKQTTRFLNSFGGVADDNALDQSYRDHTYPTALKQFIDREAKSQKALDERFPRQVQFMHLKHSNQPSFTALDSNAWVRLDECENGSGQLSIIANDYLCAVDESSLQRTLSALANDIQLVDGERVNMRMVESFDHGITCMTPIREMCAEIYGIVNECNEIIEILIHFDLEN